MNYKNTLLLGTSALALSAFDYTDPEPNLTGPQNFDSAIIYDAGSPKDVLATLKLDPKMSIAYGQQALRVLNAALATGEKQNRSACENYLHQSDIDECMFLDNFPESTLVSVKKSRADLSINADITLDDEGEYVFIDAIELKIAKDGTSQLHWTFASNENPNSVTGQVLLISDNTNTMFRDSNGETIGISSDDTGAYSELVKRTKKAAR